MVTRAVLQRLDHAAIFAMIAGTFTVARGILFRGWWRWGMLVLILGSVATAIPLKMVFFGNVPAWFGTFLYLSLGLISGIKLWNRFGFGFVRYLLWGGIAYNVGAVAEFLGHPVLMQGVFGPHEFFHIAMLVGLACHWAFVWQFVDGTIPLTEEEKMKVQSAAGVQEIIHRGVPLFQEFGMVVEEASPAYARLRLPYATRHLRHGGSLSGPAMMSLVDSAMYAVLLHNCGAEQMALTSDIQIRFLRRAPSKDAIAEARILKQGSRLVVIEVDIYADGEKDKVATRATGTCMLPHETSVTP